VTADFALKRHDLQPSIQATLYQGGIPVDLTGAASVKFTMTLIGGSTPKVNAAAVVVSAASGVVRYDWVAADTDTIGDYYGEWQVLWTAGSKPQTFPSSGYHTISIQADLDNT
jgi:hypothetical protein